MASFNPLPLPKQGETLEYLYPVGPCEVSIRSPYRSKGRLKVLKTDTVDRLFQSAPLTEARGDPCVVMFTARGTCFNPLPLPKQGETTWRDSRRFLITVSIRSPYRSKGRLAMTGGTMNPDVFQSAPLTEARGDLFFD